MTIFLDVFFNGSVLSPVNVAGAVVCLTGIAVHIFRKATNQDNGNGSGASGMKRRGKMRYDKGSAKAAEFNLPLLSDDSDLSSDEDEDELFIPGGKVRVPKEIKGGSAAANANLAAR